MRKIFFVLAIYLCIPAIVFAQAKSRRAVKPINHSGPIFKFKEEVHDFGRITDTADVSCYFKFKNVGNAPLIITVIHTSSGGVVAYQDSNALVAPGSSDSIRVIFHITGKDGPFINRIWVFSNAHGNSVMGEYDLYITGSITPLATAKR